MQTGTLSLVLLLVGATGALADDMKMPVNASQLDGHRHRISCPRVPRSSCCPAILQRMGNMWSG